MTTLYKLKEIANLIKKKTVSLQIRFLQNC